MEEKDAILLIKQGDLNGLEELVNRYQVKAVYTAYLILQDRSLAEEVVQNAFLKFVEKIDYFDESRTFSPWFLRIVVNDSIQLIRERRRLEPISEENDEDSQRVARWLIDSQPLPEDAIEVKETGEILRRAAPLPRILSNYSPGSTEMSRQCLSFKPAWSRSIVT